MAREGQGYETFVNPEKKSRFKEKPINLKRQFELEKAELLSSLQATRNMIV